MTFKKINENEQQNLHDRSCMILVNFNAKELAAIKTVSNFAGIRDRIAVKRKINLEWPPLTQNESSKLLNAVTEISKKLENSSEMTQEEADVLVNELQNAIDSLEKAPTVSTDTKNEPIQKDENKKTINCYGYRSINRLETKYINIQLKRREKSNI